VKSKNASLLLAQDDILTDAQAVKKYVRKPMPKLDWPAAADDRLDVMGQVGWW
jgi:hypothetical protein